MFFEPCSDMWQPNTNTLNTPGELIKTSQVFNSQQEQMYSFSDQQAAAMTLQPARVDPTRHPCPGAWCGSALCSQPWNFCPPSKQCKERLTLPGPGLESSSLQWHYLFKCISSWPPSDRLSFSCSNIYICVCDCTLLQLFPITPAAIKHRLSVRGDKGPLSQYQK